MLIKTDFRRLLLMSLLIHIAIEGGMTDSDKKIDTTLMLTELDQLETPPPRVVVVDSGNSN